jgi:hypothetical protein
MVVNRTTLQAMLFAGVERQSSTSEPIRRAMLNVIRVAAGCAGLVAAVVSQRPATRGCAGQLTAKRAQTIG